MTMHGRSRVTLDPRIPTIARADDVEFPLTGQAFLAPNTKHRAVLRESHDG